VCALVEQINYTIFFGLVMRNGDGTGRTLNSCEKKINKKNLVLKPN
jgi:hypothetical protein